MNFTKKEMNEILSNYRIGKFKRFGKVMKDDAVSFGQVIETTKGKFFMKIFRDFNLSVKQGLFVSGQLYKKEFPTYETYETKSKENFLYFKGKKIAFFEFIEVGKISGWKNLSLIQIKDFAKQLAIFHKHSSKMKLKKTSHGGYYDIKNLIEKSFRIRKRYNKKIQEAIIFMHDEIKNLKCKTGERKTGYFSEFNPGHVIFNGNKVKWVIDWEIGYDYRFYDLGSSLIACFDEKTKKVSKEKIKKFIISYNSEQKLSKWERNHLYEALLFGVFKYGVWGLIDLSTGKFAKDSRKVDMSEINRVLNVKGEKTFKFSFI